MVAALDWLTTRGEVREALRLAAVLSRLWDIRGQLSKGRRQLALVLAPAAAATPSLARAKVLDGVGVLALMQGDKPAARIMLKESLALTRQHGQASDIAWALAHFGFMCHETRHLKAARRFTEEALALCRELGDRRGIARCLNILGLVASSEAHFGLAQTLLVECLERVVKSAIGGGPGGR